MLDTIKSCLFSLGVGMVVGAFLAANNKKVGTAVKEATDMAEEKLDAAKKGIEKIKQQAKAKPKATAKKKTTPAK